MQLRKRSHKLPMERSVPHHIEWNGGPHARPTTIGFDFQRPVQFVHSLPHPGQPHARFCGHLTKQPHALRWYPLPEIAYLQNHSVGIMLKMDAGIRSSGVAMYVGQAFLQHTK